MPGFWTTFKKWLIISYDRLGFVLLCSFVWFVAAGLVLAAAMAISHGRIIVMVPIAAVAYTIILSPMLAAIYRLSRNIVFHDSPSAADLITGLKTYALDAWSVAFSQVIVTTFLGLNLWYYVRQGGMFHLVLAAFFVYLIVFWLMSAMYHFPLLVEQKPGVWKILKRGFLFTIGSPGFTAGVFFVIILLTCLCVLSRFLLPLVCTGMVSIMGMLALRTMFIKYGVIEPDVEPSDEDAGFEIRDIG